MDLNKWTKAELIERYMDLQAEYDDLKLQYDELDDMYGELESESNKEIDELEEQMESIEDIKASKYDYLLRDITTNADLQNGLYNVFKNYYLGIVDLYCIDVPNEVIEREKINRVNPRINKDLVKVFENYIDELMLEEDIKNI